MMLRLFTYRNPCRQPHLISRLSSSSSSTNRGNPTFRRTFASTSTDEKSRRGGVFIAAGWTLLGLVALDQVLQYRQEEEAKEHSRMLAVMQREANEMNQSNWDTSLPTIFKCKILRVEPSLDGTKMLRGIRVGDVVEVMEEGVGPHRAYHLCRLPTTGTRRESIGWYPVEFLETIN